jgi:hypothetical protein
VDWSISAIAAEAIVTKAVADNAAISRERNGLPREAEPHLLRNARNPKAGARLGPGPQRGSDANRVSEGNRRTGLPSTSTTRSKS